MNISTVNFRNIENIYKANKIGSRPVINKVRDTIEISELGKKLNEVNKDKGINIDKVNEIKLKIENGTYKIDSKDLAKKIIEHMNGEK